METFESVYYQHRDVVLRFAIRCIGRRDLAQALTAEAFVELRRNWKKVGAEQLPSWLFEVVEKRATHQLRRLGIQRTDVASGFADDAGGVTDIEDLRIRASWELPRRWPAFALIAGVAVVVFAATLGVMLGVQTPPAPITTSSSPQSAAAASGSGSTFVLKKAIVKVPARAALTSRDGFGDTSRFADDFAVAMDPYKHDEGAEAVRRLEILSKMYASSADVFYYLGVSRLLVEDNVGALAALDAASRLPHDSLRDDIAWYRAIALDRVGRTDEAKRDASTLCSRGGEYQEQACAAATSGS